MPGLRACICGIKTPVRRVGTGKEHRPRQGALASHVRPARPPIAQASSIGRQISCTYAIPVKHAYGAVYACGAVKQAEPGVTPMVIFTARTRRRGSTSRNGRQELAAMALYKLTLRALQPHTDHFREADILFTAPNDTRAGEMARTLRGKFTTRSCQVNWHRIGEGKTRNGAS